MYSGTDYHTVSVTDTGANGYVLVGRTSDLALFDGNINLASTIRTNVLVPNELRAWTGVSTSIIHGMFSNGS